MHFIWYVMDCPGGTVPCSQDCMLERARLSTENLMLVRGMGRVFLKEQVMRSGQLILPVSGIR